MQAEIIVFSRNAEPRLEKIELSPFHSELLSKINQNNQTAVALIEDKFLAELKRDIINFGYRGIKHAKKPLTYYFKKNDEKILFVHGINYRIFSQLKRSVNDFLKNAARNKLYSIFFVVVSKEFFISAKKETTKTYSPGEAKRGKFQNPLLNMIKDKDINLEIRRRYLGNSEPCLLVRQLISIAAKHDFPVLVLGETGTGKEVVARAIHEFSARKNQPFISINCGAIPTELFESEIFGSKKGSHSTARIDKKGLWEMADRGTLFLDEIGDLPLNHQVKILKALDSGEILPIGSIKPMKVDVRIVAATNKDIEALSTEKSNEFRDDLYYRISTFIIRTPPLSSHPEDIPELAERIWSELSGKRLSKGVLRQLRYMSWPGNVRSLKHFLQRLFALFGTVTITEEHIQVLLYQDLNNYLKPATGRKDKKKQTAARNFEKVIMKIECLLKATLYTDDEDQRKDLLDRVKECLEEIPRGL